MREKEIKEDNGEDDEEEKEKELNYQTWRQNRKNHNSNKKPSGIITIQCIDKDSRDENRDERRNRV